MSITAEDVSVKLLQVNQPISVSSIFPVKWAKPKPGQATRFAHLSPLSTLKLVGGARYVWLLKRFA